MTIWIFVGVLALAVLLCFLLAVANYSGERFFEKYEQYNKTEIRGGLSPLEFVSLVNQTYFNNKLKVVQISGIATDAYSKGNLFLSWQTLSVNSIASFTIIAHELGHALQDKEGRKLKFLLALKRIGRIIGLLFVPLIVAGVVMLLLGLIAWAIGMLSGGVFIFLLSLFVKLRTIYLEKDASKKAVSFLEIYLTDNELKQSKKFLNDAKLTYWADFLRILLWWTALSKKSKLFN